MTYKEPEFQLLATDLILPHEQTLDARVDEVARVAGLTGFIDYPVVVGRVANADNGTFVLLDGHHRLAAAMTRLGLDHVPAIIVDYTDDQVVTVTAWRVGEFVTKAHVIEAALSRRPMPIKTSRHSFTFESVPCNVSLCRLGPPGRHRPTSDAQISFTEREHD